MNGSDTRQRRRLIERLNAKEAELSKSQGKRPQLSKKELETETEMERQRSLSRRGFSQML
jgi:hypothetical protein